MDFHHISVLYNEVLEGLDIKKNGIYVDATLGGGGHAKGICEKLADGRLIGIDQDTDALEAAKETLKEYSSKITIINDNFKNIKLVLNDLNINYIDGAVIDLGVSSYQLDTAERGFSYKQNAPLDMRMDKSGELDAYYVVNNYSEDALFKVLSEYGEERWSKRIASFIIKEREQKSIDTTTELVEIIKKSIPASARRDGPHPAKRSFQAIRIEVNNELEIIEEAIKNFIDVMAPGGRIAVITFHSLEDRIVKNTFKQLATGCKCPPQFPICVCGGKPKVKLINRKPILPNGKELDKNFRARSSKLRIAEKL